MYQVAVEAYRPGLGRSFEQIFIGRWQVTNVPFEHGYIGIRERTYSKDHVEIVQDLAEALSLGYLRFLDFQKVEEQNRELTIQNALERVRARALGMQTSDDLATVSTTLFDEVKGLGIPAAVSSIGVFDEDHKFVRVAPTMADGSVEWFTVPLDRLMTNPVFAETMASFKAGEPWYAAQIEGDEAEAFDKLWASQSDNFEQMTNPRRRVTLTATWFFPRMALPGPGPS